MAGVNNVSVAFTAPSAIGGSVIDNYRGTSTVAAHNAYCWSAESAPSNCATPQAAAMPGVCGNDAGVTSVFAPSANLC